MAQFIPTLIQNYIFDAVFSCEIDVVFICLIIYARLKINSINIICIPPVPCNMARFNPFCIGYLIRLGKLINQITFKEFYIILSNNKYPPWKSSCTFCFGYIVLCAGNKQITVTNKFFCIRILWPYPWNFSWSGSFNPHSGVIIYVRFCNKNIGATNLEKCRETGKMLIDKCIDCGIDKCSFIMRHKTGFNRVPCEWSGRKEKFWDLIFYCDILFQGCLKSVGYSIVVGSEL